MPAYRNRLPQLDAPVFLTDGGIETTLVFHDGLELPDFAAFTLLEKPDGRAALDRYFDSYAAIAARDGVGIVLETATWRANPDWGARQGLSVEQLDAINADAVDMLVRTRARHETADAPVVISGCIGPRGDGYQLGATMTADEARAYHGVQARAFAATEADLITAITMTYAEEAIGVAEAARAVGMPVVLSFTVETDGRLPSGQELGDAIVAVDAATDSLPGVLHGQLRTPDALPTRPRRLAGVGVAVGWGSGQRVEAEPRRARRGRDARQRRPDRPRRAVPGPAGPRADAAGARRVLRHRPAPHRRDEPALRLTSRRPELIMRSGTLPVREGCRSP